MGTESIYNGLSPEGRLLIQGHIKIHQNKNCYPYRKEIVT